MSTDFSHTELSSTIIRCFYNVYNKLGYGFLEQVYENAMMIELDKNGLFVEKQKPIQVFYDDQVVGMYFADLVVENTIILELKATAFLCQEHEFQLINYLKATDVNIGLLLNFGKKPEVKRKICTKK